MGDDKRYYWMKLNENFFEDDTVLWLEEQEGGEKYVLFYLKLCLKSLKDGGVLVRYVGNMLIPYDVNALAKLTNTDVDTVAVALKIFEEIGLIERKETGEIYMSQINEMIGTETQGAKRKRIQRAKNKAQKLLETNDGTMSQESPDDVQKCPDRYKSIEYRDIDIRDTDIEIEKDLDINNNIVPTNADDEEVIEEPFEFEETSNDSVKFGKDSEEYEIAVHLTKSILKTKPNANINHIDKKKQQEGKLVISIKKIQNWCKHIGYMMRVDGKTPDQIKWLFDWAQNNTFWQSNILSPQKLREKWDTLELQARNEYKKSAGGMARQLDEWL